MALCTPRVLNFINVQNDDHNYIVNLHKINLSLILILEHPVDLRVKTIILRNFVIVLLL